MRERVLITGISGFIGSSLGEYFASRGVSVVGCSRQKVATTFLAETIKTSYRPIELAGIVKRFTPDVIIHAAGPSSVRESIENPSRDFSKSVILLHRLLEGVRISGVRPRIVFPSSAAVYGDPERIPVAENAPLIPISPYGYHKCLCEKLLEEYARTFGVSSLVIRLFSVFGPNQKRLLIWELFDQFRNRAEINLEGTGNEVRDYIHVADLASCVERLLSARQDQFLTVNVASGREIAIREVVSLMKGFLGSVKPIIFKGKARYGDPFKWQADVSLFELLTKKRVKVDFPSSLRSCLAEWGESSGLC